MDKMELLTRLTCYIDGQADQAEREAVDILLAQRPELNALLKRLQEATGMVAGALVESSPVRVSGSTPEGECLDDETLIRLADKALPPSEQRRIDKHLVSCDDCLLRVMENVRTSVSMARGAWPELPPSLREQEHIKALVNVQDALESDETWRHVNLSVAGKKQARHHICHAGLDVEMLCKSGDKSFEIGLKLRDAERTRRDRELTLTDDSTGRKVLSGTTDSKGAYTISRLRPGKYTLHIVGSSLKVAIRVEV